MTAERQPAGGSEAARIAREIAAGALDLRRVFEERWTFAEDLEFWALPPGRSWRAVRPDRREELAATAQLLDVEGRLQLVELLLEGHRAYQRLLLEREEERELLAHADEPWSPPDPDPERHWLVRFRRGLEQGDYYDVFGEDLWLAGELVERLAIPIEREPADALQRLRRGFETVRIPVIDMRAPHYDEAYQRQAREARRKHHLSRFKGASDEETRARLHQAFADRGHPFRWEAPPALVAMEASRAIPTLVQTCRDHHDPIMSAAIFELGELGQPDPAAIAVLIDVVRDAAQRDPDNRWRAVVALGKIRSPDAAQVVVEYASTWGARENQRAVVALGSIGGPTAEAYLLFLVENAATDEHWREIAIWSLARMRSDRAVEAITRQIQRRAGHEPMGYETGAVALANIGTPRAMKALREHARWGGDHFRRALHQLHERTKPGARILAEGAPTGW